MEKEQEEMTKEMADFLLKEFDIDYKKLDDMESEELQKLYDDCCEIEVDKCMKSAPLAERGEIAADLVTYLWFTYAELEE